MLSENGTFKVVASLTPERVTFSAGGYKVTGQRVHLTVEQKEVVFNIVKGEVLRSDTKMKAHKLIWVSGTTSYFKKGISFVETMPAVWGEPGL